MIAIATLSRVVCTPSPHSGALGDSASSARFQKVFEYRVLNEIYWFLSDSNTGFIVFADRFRRSPASEHALG
jgi:hypothetical protein